MHWSNRLICLFVVSTIIPYVLAADPPVASIKSSAEERLLYIEGRHPKPAEQPLVRATAEKVDVVGDGWSAATALGQLVMAHPEGQGLPANQDVSSPAHNCSMQFMAWHLNPTNARLMHTSKTSAARSRSKPVSRNM